MNAAIEVTAVCKRFGPVLALDASALQPGRTGRNHLLSLAHSQGLDARRVDRVAAQAGLETAIRRKAGGYSLGMRQRLGIAAALLGDPPALIFDEPFNGMDPEGIIWMRELLASLEDAYLELTARAVEYRAAAAGKVAP